MRRYLDPLVVVVVVLVVMVVLELTTPLPFVNFLSVQSRQRCRHPNLEAVMAMVPMVLVHGLTVALLLHPARSCDCAVAAKRIDAV